MSNNLKLAVLVPVLFGTPVAAELTIVLLAAGTQGPAPLTTTLDASQSLSSTEDDLRYVWDFGDGTFDTIPYPVHEYSFVDTFYTTLTVSNGICISRYYKMVNQKDFMPNEPDPDPGMSLEIDQVNVYPNPASGILHVEIKLNNKANLKVVLTNPMGQNLKSDFQEETNSFLMDYDLTDFAQGVYYLQITAESLKGKITEMHKILKTNY